MTKKIFHLLIGIFFSQISNAQTKYHYDYFFSPERSFFIPASEDSSELFSYTDLDTLYDGIAIVNYISGAKYYKEIFESGKSVKLIWYYRNGKKTITASIGVEQKYMYEDISYVTFSLREVYGFDNAWDSLSRKTAADGNGKVNFYYPNRKLMQEGEIKDGLKNGEWKGYYPNGSIMYIGYAKWGGLTVGTLFSMNGDTLVAKGNGDFVNHYPNGQISMRGSYKGGRLQGNLTYFYPNGRIKERTYLDSNAKKWIYESYYITGELCFKGAYKFGKPSGEWNWFDKNGNIVRTKNYGS